jgi:hypothetical protein
MGDLGGVEHQASRGSVNSANERHGRLHVGPRRSTISIDGTSRGVTPLRLSLPPGQHSFDIVSGGVTRRLPLTVEANTVVSQHVELVAEPAAVPKPAPAPRPAEPDLAARAAIAAGAGGFLAIDSPLEVEVLENGTLIGSTRTARMMLPVGSHRLDFSSPGVEFSTTRTVQISAGKTSTVALALPDGMLSINAVPGPRYRSTGATPG